MQRSLRLKRELLMLSTQPPPGVSCWQDKENPSVLKAQIIGAEDTPYDGGIFVIHLSLPDRYPFEPPKVCFVTPIYHPNIDERGRICLDTLKMPPQAITFEPKTHSCVEVSSLVSYCVNLSLDLQNAQSINNQYVMGAWKPSVNIATLLSSIRLLMADPNSEDPLMAEISAEYKYDRLAFTRKAKEWTKRYAIVEQGCSSTACHTRDGACSETASENSLSSEQTTSGKVGSLKRNAADHQPSEQKKAKLG